MQVIDFLIKGLIIKPKVDEETLKQSGIPLINKEEVKIFKTQKIVTTGSGIFYSGEYKSEQVSIKIIDITKDEAIVNEFLLWKLYTGNERILQMKGVCIDYGEAYIVFENFQYTLESALRNRLLNQENKIKIANQCINILDFLQQTNQYIMDIRPGTLALTNNFRVKLIDFGIIVTKEKLLNESLVINERVKYMPPEYIFPSNKGNYDSINQQPYDIWSFGCLLIDLFSNEPVLLQNNSSIKDIKNLIISNEFPKIPEDINIVLGDIIARCLQPDVNNRVQIYELKANVDIFLQNFSENYYYNSGLSTQDPNSRQLKTNDTVLKNGFGYCLEIENEIHRVNSLINETLQENVQKLKNDIHSLENNLEKKIKSKKAQIISLIENISDSNLYLSSLFKKQILINILQMQDYYSTAMQDMIDIENKTNEMKLNIKTLSQFSNKECYQSLFNYIQNTKENIDKTLAEYSVNSAFDKIDFTYSENSKSVDLYCNFLENLYNNFDAVFENISSVVENISQFSDNLFENLKMEKEVLVSENDKDNNLAENAEDNPIKNNDEENKNIIKEPSISEEGVQNEKNLKLNGILNNLYIKAQENSNLVIIYNSSTKVIKNSVIQFPDYQVNKKFNYKSYSLFDQKSNSLFISGGLTSLTDKNSSSSNFYKLVLNSVNESEEKFEFEMKELCYLNNARYSHTMYQLNSNKEILLCISGANTKSCEAYNIDLNLWKNLPDLPTFAPNAGVYELDEYVYVFANYNNLEYIYRINIFTNDDLFWENLEFSINEGKIRRGMGCIGMENSIILLGGFDSNFFYDDVYCFTSSADNHCINMVDNIKMPSKSCFGSNILVLNSLAILMDSMNSVTEFNLQTKEFYYYG